MTLKINSLVRLSLIGAIAAATVPMVPTIALAAGNAGYCEGPAYIEGEPLGGGVFAAYVRAGDIRVECAGSRTHFDGECDADDRLVFITAERRNGVVYIDCH